MSLISDAIVSEEELAAIFQILGGSSTAHTPRQQPGPSEGWEDAVQAQPGPGQGPGHSQHPELCAGLEHCPPPLAGRALDIYLPHPRGSASAEFAPLAALLQAPSRGRQSRGLLG